MFTEVGWLSLVLSVTPVQHHQQPAQPLLCAVAVGWMGGLWAAAVTSTPGSVL
jgi:hypothetical protein